jgi:hypothetical protein
MKPTMMVSMAVVGLELLAEAHVKRADDEEGQGEAGVEDVVHGVWVLEAYENCTENEGGYCEAKVEDVVHGVLGRLSTGKMHARPILPS